MPGQSGKTGLVKKPPMAVQVYGRKKTAVAIAHCKRGRGLLKINGYPLHLLKPKMLQDKVKECLILIGNEKLSCVDIRVRVSGGGNVSQIYAVRQAIARSMLAFYQKFVDEASKTELKNLLINYDRTLVVADRRVCEPKKFGGPAARARYQKSYR